MINCFCVLVPDVKLPRESAADRLKKEAESGIIEGEGSLENAAEKAAAIEKEFRYTDAWGDEYSPIDRASFAAMPAQAQQRAADGIRKAQELFKLDALPKKIAFGDTRGAYGLYSETTRTLTLSKSKCMDPEEAYSTMVHELTHYYDHVSGHIAESVYKQALKEMGLRANSREASNLLRLLIGDGYTKEDQKHEALAYAVEKTLKGKSNKLAAKIFEIITR